ncbi:M67 family metallopeptidase [Laspinema sp. D1]|uniref:M67 family metallopeptidase n=1 Tax=Laspinema palackyanum D2a TaxID=2953684 RepID=A0ABT2MT25_9CYAN|nr:M67 family metallopeptidase [Laspinema sp. D2a]
MILTLTATHETTIRTHAERTYPEECCGLLLGEITPTGKTVLEVWETENAWSPETAGELSAPDTLTKERRYVIHPKDLLRAQKQGRDRQLKIIGIYHSHPDHPAIPSECDREYAWSEYSYIIVSVEQGQATQLTNWSLDETHHFQPETLVIARAES